MTIDDLFDRPDPDAAAEGPVASPATPRRLRIAAAQLGPIGRHETRASVVDRLIDLLERAAAACSGVVA